MASNTSLKFYKFNSSTGDYASRVNTAKAVEGAIIYLVDVHELWVGGTNPQLALKGASEVSFADNMLTVKTYDATGTPTTQTLDFSDTASASATLNVFKHITYDLIGAVQTSNPASTKLDYGTTAYLQGVQTLVAADKALDTQIKNIWTAMEDAGKVDEVQINGTDIVNNKVANILTDGAYVTTGTQNLIATQSTVSSAIAALDVTDSKGDASISGSTITIQGVKQNDGQIIDGDVTTINLDGAYDDSTNKIATQGTVTNAIEALDVSDFAMAGVNGNTIQIKGLKEVDGKVESIGTTGNNGAVEILLDGNYSATSGSENLIATQSTVSTAVANAVAALDGSAGIAAVADGVVTLKAGVTETDGVITNSSGSDIVLAKVATTGSADDVEVTYQSATQTVSQAVTKIDSRITALEELPTYDVVVLGQSENLPTASADTMHKIYLKPLSGTQPQGDIYEEYITVRSGSEGSYTYSWEKLGTTAASLDGYAKSVTVNGQTYTVPSNSTDINIGNAITGVSGETAISGGNSEFIAVTATTSAASGGAQGVTLTSNVKLQSVSAASSSAQGLAEASDVKNYVDTQIGGLDKASTTKDGTNVHVTYSENDGIVSLDTITEDYATIRRTAKASGVAPNLVVTSGDENKLVKASNIADVKAYADDKVADEIEKLDADITSDDAAVASVEVVETNGKITDVVVTNISAGVQYTTASGDTPANLAASTSTGAVTGADIAAIKNYVDAQSSSVSDGAQTLTVNDANMSTLATVDGTPITAKVALVWEEYV